MCRFSNFFLTLSALACLYSFTACAEEVIETPRPVPATRVQMKQLLEDMKTRSYRIPIPDLTPEEQELLGDRADNYETRLRFHYLSSPEEVLNSQRSRSRGGATSSRERGTTSRGGRQNADESMSLSYPFKTMLFWIVSRTNNCQYCLGHQEQKLSAAGLSEAEIAALDLDWSHYTPAEQAAFAYARQLTYLPHTLADADIEKLSEHYTTLQILEMTLSVAGNNATNRWKEGTGIPQSSSGSRFFSGLDLSPQDVRRFPIETFLTPTAEAHHSAVSVVAPLERSSTGEATGKGVVNRPALESRAEVLQTLQQTAQRVPRLSVLSAEQARTVLGERAPAGDIPQWMRLVAHFPNDAGRRWSAIQSLTAPAEHAHDLSPLLKAQVRWIVARQDRAWYVTAQAYDQLQRLGQTDDQIFALDGDWSEFDAAERSLFRFARQLACTPIALTDVTVATALEETGPRQVVQMIEFVTGCAYLNRITEAAGLPWDGI